MSNNGSDTKAGYSASAQSKSDRDWISGLLAKAQDGRWFGTMIIEIKRGAVDMVRHEQTLKPPKTHTP